MVDGLGIPWRLRASSLQRSLAWSTGLFVLETHPLSPPPGHSLKGFNTRKSRSCSIHFIQTTEFLPVQSIYHDNLWGAERPPDCHALQFWEDPGKQPLDSSNVPLLPSDRLPTSHQLPIKNYSHLIANVVYGTLRVLGYKLCNRTRLAKGLQKLHLGISKLHKGRIHAVLWLSLKPINHQHEKHALHGVH